MARWIAAGLLLIAAAALVVAGAFQYLKIRFERPGPLAAETVIVIPKGAGLASIAGQLEAAGIVDDANIFRLGVRFLDLSRSLQESEFAFVAGITMRETAETIAAGKTVVHRLTAPEGETTKEILALLAATPVLTGPVPSSLAEGELLPETYYFSRGDTRAQVAERMRRSMTELLAELWPERAEGLPLPTRGAGGAPADRRRLHQPFAQAHAPAVRSDRHLRHHLGPGAPRSPPDEGGPEQADAL
jgi:UPF0755 protein